MDLDLKGRSALVTGSSSGIGRAIALQLGEEGATVAVTYHHDRAGAEQVAEQIRSLGGIALVGHYDLDDPSTGQALVRRLAEEHGGPDLLVGNAVAWPRGSAGGPSGWRASLRANLEGTIATIDGALPHLIDVEGRIVLVSSTVAIDGMAGATTYAAAKAGLHGVVAALSVEHGPAGVLTNAVLPGLTLTDRAHQVVPAAARDRVAQRTPTRRLTQPRDVARLVAFLGSPANRQVTGQLLRVDGGLSSRP